jgi:two-component system sensor histidine kinase PhoQ
MAAAAGAAHVPSLSRKLVLSVAVPLVLFFGLTIAVLDGMFRNLAMQSQRELLEQELVALVSSADSTAEGNLGVRQPDPESSLATPGSGSYALVRNAAGEELWRSPSLAGVMLDVGPPIAAGTRASFMRQLRDGARIAVLSRGLRWEFAPGRSSDLVFSVATSMEPYYQQLWRLRQTLFGWFALLTVLLLAVLGWLLQRTLAPVRRLEREIGEVERGERERLGERYPRELAGVTANLNTLLHSERQRIARYRDTLGNLAHGLKTPLAVMRAALTQGSEQRATLDREIDRVAQIVDHQLKRAATGGGASLGQAPVAVAPLAADLRAALLKVHAARDLSIELHIAADAGFLGDRGDLVELLGNLLDNACKWCRHRVLLQAAIDLQRVRPLQLVLSVEDDGPGIQPADRERVLARGVRADEQAPGHGLGLAMVRDTVALYNAELQIDSSPQLGGARLELWLPGRSLPPGA